MYYVCIMHIIYIFFYLKINNFKDLNFINFELNINIFFFIIIKVIRKLEIFIFIYFVII